MDHTEINHPVHYPGVGLTAEVQAFNAYKRWHELQRALSPSAYVKYDKIMVEYDAAQRQGSWQRPPAKSVAIGRISTKPARYLEGANFFVQEEAAHRSHLPLDFAEVERRVLAAMADSATPHYY